MVSKLIEDCFYAAEQKPCIHMNIRYTNENVATKNNTNAFCYCQQRKIQRKSNRCTNISVHVYKRLDHAESGDSEVQPI